MVFFFLILLKNYLDIVGHLFDILHFYVSVLKKISFAFLFFRLYVCVCGCVYCTWARAGGLAPNPGIANKVFSRLREQA
jgi:hypothetical protein